jgi:hypothetical protein
VNVVGGRGASPHLLEYFPNADANDREAKRTESAVAWLLITLIGHTRGCKIHRSSERHEGAAWRVRFRSQSACVLSSQTRTRTVVEPHGGCVEAQR